MPGRTHSVKNLDFKQTGKVFSSPRDWGGQAEAVNGDFLSLKELNVGRSDVLDTLIRAYKHWIRTADIDGFRVDTVKHMEDTATAIFCNAVREYAKKIGKDNFFIFGEIVENDMTLQRYIGRNTRIEGTNERFPSEDGNLFSYPDQGRCTLAFSRVLDTDEVLVAINLASSPRNDRVTGDWNLTPPGLCPASACRAWCCDTEAPGIISRTI